MRKQEIKWRQDFKEYPSDLEYFLQHTLKLSIESHDFWWADVFEFYTRMYQHQNPEAFKTVPKYSNFDAIELIVKNSGLDVDWVDAGGNNFINYIIHRAYSRDSERVMLFDHDIDKVLSWSEMPALLNNANHNFFWTLNTITYTYMQAQEKLLPLIERYNIDVTVRDSDGRNLLDKAIEDHAEDRVDMYLALGLHMREDAYNNFLFTGLHVDSVVEMFDQTLLSVDPFAVQPGRREHAKESLMDCWLKFIEGGNSANSARYTDNIEYVLDKIIDNKVKIDDTKRACKYLRAVKPHLHYDVRPVEIAIEKMTLEKTIKTDKKSRALKV